MSPVSLPQGGADAVTANYARLFLETDGLNIWLFSDTTTRDKFIFKICHSVNFEVGNTLQVSEKD